jgi:hypothetical protein
MRVGGSERTMYHMARQPTRHFTSIVSSAIGSHLTTCVPPYLRCLMPEEGVQVVADGIRDGRATNRLDAEVAVNYTTHIGRRQSVAVHEACRRHDTRVVLFVATQAQPR